jgi:hypothetical protein
MAVILGIIVLWLITHLIISENRKFLWLMKILGYYNYQIILLIFGIYFPFLIAGFSLSILGSY